MISVVSSQPVWIMLHLKKKKKKKARAAKREEKHFLHYQQGSVKLLRPFVVANKKGAAEMFCIHLCMAPTQNLLHTNAPRPTRRALSSAHPGGPGSCMEMPSPRKAGLKVWAGSAWCLPELRSEGQLRSLCFSPGAAACRKEQQRGHGAMSGMLQRPGLL